MEGGGWTKEQQSLGQPSSWIALVMDKGQSSGCTTMAGLAQTLLHPPVSQPRPSAAKGWGGMGVLIVVLCAFAGRLREGLKGCAFVFPTAPERPVTPGSTFSMRNWLQTAASLVAGHHNISSRIEQCANLSSTGIYLPARAFGYVQC